MAYITHDARSHRHLSVGRLALILGSAAVWSAIVFALRALA